MVVIVNGLRTAIGKYGGSLANTAPDEMFAVLIRNNLSSCGYDGSIIDEVIVGHTKQSAHYPNIARVAALKAGLDVSVPAYTVHRQCGSGMQAVLNGYMAIRLGMAEAIIAGGVENMSQAPYYFTGNRQGIPPGNLVLYDSNTESQYKSQPEDQFGSFNMGETAEYLAEKYGISRQEQDEFACASQMKAVRAVESDRFSDEIVPMEISPGKGQTALFTKDEFPRPDTSLEKLAKLKPVFKPGGTVTAGNSSGRNDGAASLLLMKEDKARSLEIRPMARIVAISVAAVHPKEMGLGPVPAVRKALQQAGLTLNDIGLIELNEAFAAQSIAVLKELGLYNEKDMQRLNVNGGAIALGHPIGCSGARILVTLIHEMRKRNVRYGLATLCVAGGMGMATIVENID